MLKYSSHIYQIANYAYMNTETICLLIIDWDNKGFYINYIIFHLSWFSYYIQDYVNIGGRLYNITVRIVAYI